jgi:thiol-disulfide isomerase/thioredoxin
MKNLHLILLAWFVTAAAASALERGSTREQVIAECGNPRSEMVNGQFTTMVYERGTVRLRKGLVTDFSPLLVKGVTNAVAVPRGLPAAKADKVSKKGSGKLDIEKVLVPGKITLVDFYADWCGPCRRLGPLLEDMAKHDPDVYLCKVNIKDWESPVAKQFSLRGIPHVRVFGRDGRQVGQGTSGLEQIKALVEEARKAAPTKAAPGV